MKNRCFALLLSLILLLASVVAFSLPAYAEPSRTVRVGWHEPPYFITDQYDRHSGYTYEYQRKLAAYTGWNYEYVEGSWSELLNMLKNGEIDLMGNVSFTPERTASMLFPSLPMGTEAYYIYTTPDNTEISSEDYQTLNGKRVGVTKGSIQKDLFVQWADVYDLQVDLVELSTPDEESMRLLTNHELDAFVTVDVYGDPAITEPVCKVGSSDFYFAVSKDHPDLLAELNNALNRIQDENKYYNQQLHEKYLNSTSSDAYLSAAEKDWLAEHGTIRIGYQDNYLAFCAKDPVTGKLTGALQDFLDYASTCLENSHLDFEAVAYPSASAAIEAMKNGEVDCMFPANLTDNDSEELDVFMTPALMRTEMDAVVRAAEQKEFIRKEHVIVAVNEGNTNYDMFLADHYPNWQRAYFPDTPTGLDAVAAGKADCVIISNYRFNNISKQCEDLHLTTVYTGVDMDYCLAVNHGDTELYSILSRVIGLVPDATIHTALTYYSTEDVKISFVDLIKDNLFIVMTVIAGVLLVILILLIHSIRAERKILEEEHLVADLNKKVFVDALTSVRNKGAYADYVQNLQDQLEKQEDPIEFAIGVFDCDNLKLVNDYSGHDKGDIYIKSACRLICKTFAHSPVFRIGGDEFAVVLQNEDYQNRDELVEKFKALQMEMCSSAENQWEEPRVAMGIAAFDPEIDTTVDDTMRRADRFMYEDKRVRKGAR